MPRLNLGCGAFKKDGFINVDADPRTSPDVLHDLNVLPYPFPPDHFDAVEADHVLEHLHDPFAVMRELHRILKPGGSLTVRVPHFSRGMTHPDHKRGFDVTFPYYFQPAFKGGYAGVAFECLRASLHWFSQPYLKKTVLSLPSYAAARIFGAVADVLARLWPFLCSRVWCFWVGGFEEIRFDFRCRK